MHDLVYYNDVEGMLNHLRNEYWVIKGRKNVTKVLKHYSTCKYLNPKPVLSAETVDLPNFHINCNHAFENVGIDFCVTIYSKNIYGASEDFNRSYVLLFKYTVTRAVR